MSIASMSEAKLVREHSSGRSANPVEKALGIKRLVERDKTPDKDTPEPTGVPQGITARLMRWIPTETITLYVAFIALFSPLEAASGKTALCTAPAGFVGRWAGVVAFSAATVVVVVLVHLAKVRHTKEPFRWPWFEMVVAPTAFAAWALALPDTPLYDACSYKPEIGGFIVLGTTIAIGLVAEALGKQPPDVPMREASEGRRAAP